MPDMTDNPRKEGDVYKTVVAGGHSFSLRYGYYEDFERNRGEPVVIYPDLKETPMYSTDGFRLVTAIQDVCDSFEARDAVEEDSCCCDCIFYPNPQSCIDICTCEQNREK